MQTDGRTSRQTDHMRFIQFYQAFHVSFRLFPVSFTTRFVIETDTIEILTPTSYGTTNKAGLGCITG